MKNEVGIIINIIKNDSQQLNFGFIKHTVLGDLFFHHRNIEQQQNKNNFIENELVIFVAKPSKKHPDKLEAVNVKLLSTEFDFTLLLRCLFEAFIESPESKLTQSHICDRIEYLLNASNDKKLTDEVFILFENLISSLTLSDNLLSTSLVSALTVCKKLFPRRYESTCNKILASVSDQIAHRLWLEKLIDVCQVSYIVDLIFSPDDTSQDEALKRCTEYDKSAIFSEVIDRCNAKGDKVAFGEIRNILKLSRTFAPSQQLIVINSLIRNRSTYEKLTLWLDGTYDDLNFNEFKNCVYMLSANDQTKFIKKTLKYVHEEKANVTVNDLISVNVISYESSKSLEKSEGVCLDYSTGIALNTIDELYKKTTIRTLRASTDARNRMFNIILDQIKDPNDILEIRGYFDDCKGRTSARFKSISDESVPQEVELVRYRAINPKFHLLCDGRKARDRDGIPVLDKTYNINFWWCANNPCFELSRKAHSHEEWESYSLLDFLKILKVDFDEIDLEMYLSIINKANLFLKHLKCRACGQILRPKNQSNYAFYGVNNFYCMNQSCEESNNKVPVYLSHCMNGNCGHVIDSRDTVKCDKGWYICTHCYACCTTKTFQLRIETLEKMKQDYKGPVEGHRDLGNICCHKCGKPMEATKIDIEKYNNVLTWFINNCDGSDPRIGKSGTNKLGKRWFIFKRASLSQEKYLEKVRFLASLGFDTPDVDINNRDYQLISEPLEFKTRPNTTFECKSCKISLEVSSDRERLAAIKSFHNVIFPK